MMKTYLPGCAVRRPVVPDVTARISWSRLQAALHQEFALAFANERDGLRRRRLAVRRVDESVRGYIEARLARRRSRFSPWVQPGPDDDFPASAASTAPRSEVSSQGWATIVVADGGLLRPRDQLIVFLVAHMNGPVGFGQRHDSQAPFECSPDETPGSSLRSISRPLPCSKQADNLHGDNLHDGH